MVRINWLRLFFIALTLTSWQLNQLAVASGIPANAVGRTIVVNEAGKPAKCTVIKVWQQQDGTGVMIVECLDTGEKLTIVEAGMDKKAGKKLAARIYHWGRGHIEPPAGAPVPPAEKNMLTQNSSQLRAPDAPEVKSTNTQTTKSIEKLPEIIEKAPATPSRASELPQITSKDSAPTAASSSGSNEPLPVIQNKKDTRTAGRSLQDRLRWNHGADKSASLPAQETQTVSTDSTTVTPVPYAKPVWNQIGTSAAEKENRSEKAAPVATTLVPVPKVTNIPEKAAPVATTVVPVPKVTNIPVQQTVAKPDMQDLPPNDWRESWGTLKDSTPAPTGKAEKKTATKSTGTKSTITVMSTDKPEKADPLLDPEAYSKVPAADKVVQKVDAMKVQDSKARAALQPTTPKLPDPVIPVAKKSEAVPDLPPDDFRPEPEAKVATHSEALPTIPEHKAAPPIVQRDLPPAAPQKVVEPITPQAFVIQTASEPANPKSIMAPSGINSMLYTTPAKEDPSLAPLPFGDKDKIKQWKTILRESIYPSQREWAADQLSACDWHKNLQLVPDLLKAAKEDPAATVRAYCIRCLARMNVDTVPVVLAIQGMKKDPDPRVQSEVEEALAVLAPDLPMKGEKPTTTSKEEVPMAKEMPVAAEPDLPPSDGPK